MARLALERSPGTHDHLLRYAVFALAVTSPMAGLALLLVTPMLDVEWHDNPAHFWLVFAVAAVTAFLALLMNDAARRRLDTRVLFVSLAFLVSAASLGIHAIATPGVILERGNAGFELDVPIGLLGAALLAAASSLPLARARSARMHARVTVSVVAALALWAVVSLALLDEPLESGTEDGLLLGLPLAGLLLYAFAGARYALLWWRRPSSLLVAIFSAFLLLAEAMVAIAFARNWHATWWEWHLLILLAFAVVAASVWAEWKAEGASADVFADVYLEETSAGSREVSVLFADLKGFTTFSEQTPPREVFAMLNTYFDAIVPAVASGEGGTVDKLIGDAIMLTFNTRGDQPDHALRAARAGLALQREAASVRFAHPGWPLFRVGINTGHAMVGLLGPRGARSYTVVGDVVNVAARLEGSAGVDEVVVGNRTRELLGPGAAVEAREAISLKGKAETVSSFRLLSVEPALQEVAP